MSPIKQQHHHSFWGKATSTHLVRRYFLIICFIAVIFLITSSWRLVSTWGGGKERLPRKGNLISNFHYPGINPSLADTPKLKLLPNQFPHADYKHESNSAHESQLFNDKNSDRNPNHDPSSQPSSDRELWIETDENLEENTPELRIENDAGGGTDPLGMSSPGKDVASDEQTQEDQDYGEEQETDGLDSEETKEESTRTRDIKSDEDLRKAYDEAEAKSSVPRTDSTKVKTAYEEDHSARLSDEGRTATGGSPTLLASSRRFQPRDDLHPENPPNGMDPHPERRVQSYAHKPPGASDLSFHRNDASLNSRKTEPTEKTRAEENYNNNPNPKPQPSGLSVSDRIRTTRRREEEDDTLNEDKRRNDKRVTPHRDSGSRQSYARPRTLPQSVNVRPDPSLRTQDNSDRRNSEIENSLRNQPGPSSVQNISLHNERLRQLIQKAERMNTESKDRLKSLRLNTDRLDTQEINTDRKDRQGLNTDTHARLDSQRIPLKSRLETEQLNTDTRATLESQRMPIKSRLETERRNTDTHPRMDSQRTPIKARLETEQLNTDAHTRMDTHRTDTKDSSQRTDTQDSSQTQKTPDKPKTSPLPDDGFDETGSRNDKCAHCFHSNFPALIDHAAYCQDFSPETIALLLISSAPPNSRKRQAIRSTWGSQCQDPQSHYRCLFVLGESSSPQQNDQLRRENDQHGDILQFGFQDAYSNLTFKTLTSLNWVARKCGKVAYVMKTDDDMYVNTELIPTLLTATPTSNFVGGYCWGNSPPNRDVSSKWFVPLKSFKCSLFPPMCSGTGYIMSRDVVVKVLSASENIPFFHLEDVYVALCLQKFGIQPVRISGFNNMYVRFDACYYRHQIMTSHQVPTEQLEMFWSQLQQCPSRQHRGEDLFIKLPYPAV